MQAIAWLLIGTVLLAYICEFLKRYGHLLLVLTGDALLAGVGLIVLTLVLRAAWPWFCDWYERRQVRAQATRAIQRVNQHYENSRAEMEQLARLHHLRKGISQ